MFLRYRYNILRVIYLKLILHASASQWDAHRLLSAENKERRRPRKGKRTSGCAPLDFFADKKGGRTIPLLPTTPKHVRRPLSET